MASKTRFEEGLNNSDMQQYLRLHALSDTFENTVQKARRFGAFIEARHATFPRICPNHFGRQFLERQTGQNRKHGSVSTGK